MKKQRYELISGKSAKFWEVYVRGSSMTTAYGRVNTKGQRTVKEFESANVIGLAPDSLSKGNFMTAISVLGSDKNNEPLLKGMTL